MAGQGITRRQKDIYLLLRKKNITLLNGQKRIIRCQQKSTANKITNFVSVVVCWFHKQRILKSLDDVNYRLKCA